MDAPTSPSSAEAAEPPTPATPGRGSASSRGAAGRRRRLEGIDGLRAALADPDAHGVGGRRRASGIRRSARSRSCSSSTRSSQRTSPSENQRAKVEETEGTVHVVMFWIAYEGAITEHRGGPRPQPSVAAHGPRSRAGTRSRCRSSGATSGHILKRGPDFLLYSITDGIVDGYFPVLDALDDEIDALQDDVIQKPTSWTLERLFALKKELIGLRRAMSPAREIFNQLTNRDLALVKAEHVVYFRDVYDHLIRVTDELDNDRELVAGTLEVYLSTINNNLSTIMKRLTGVTVILAGIGAFAGVFGMSEAGTAIANGEASGFWVITALIVVGAAITAVVLRRIDWI